MNHLSSCKKDGLSQEAAKLLVAVAWSVPRRPLHIISIGFHSLELEQAARKHRHCPYELEDGQVAQELPSALGFLPNRRNLGNLTTSQILLPLRHFWKTKQREFCNLPTSPHSQS